MTWLLPICDSEVPEEVLVDAVQLLLRTEEATRLALSKLGAGTELPPLVLADDTICAKFADLACPVPTAPLVAAWAGGGELDARNLSRAWHRGSGALRCAGYPRDRLRRTLPEPLPAQGSHLAAVNLQAIYGLERAVHSAGHKSVARRHVLIELAAQRALLCAMLGATVVTSSAAHPLLGQLHQRLLSRHPAGARLAPMLRWIEGLYGQPSDPCLFDLHPTHRAWGEVLLPPPKSIPWGVMVSQLGKAGLRVYGVDRPPPDPPTELGGPLIDSELGPLLQETEMWHKPVETDRLGLYVRERSGSPLAPGVHLFCERIEQVRFFDDPEVLAWAALWHELAHWRLDDLGAPPSDLHRLRALNIEELFCEVEAHRALQRGHPPWLHDTGIAWPSHSAMPLRRWRESEIVLPYSWYPRMLLLREVVTTEQWERFVLVTAQDQRRADDPWANPADRDAAAVGTVDHLIRLLRGEMPLEAAVRWIDAVASRWDGSPQMLARPVVYLWRQS